MKKIIVSAFEPFGGFNVNSSYLVLQQLKPRYGDTEVSLIVLPVLYKKAFDLLKTAIEKEKPDYIICMGQAGGREKVCIERIAVNINSAASADNEGTIKTDEIIIPYGPNAYFTNLPHKDMLGICGGDTVISYSAGTYICNDIFYRLMNFIENSDREIKGGFIHLPFTEHFDKMSYMKLEKQLKTVEAILTAAED